MTKKISVDLCIIGAGSAGLSVAAGAAQLGRKVALVEQGEMGGDCLNYGCVPSKSLIAAAAHAAAIAQAPEFGVTSSALQIDFGAVMRHVHDVIAAIAPHDSQARFEDLGVTVIRARGAFTGPRELAAGEAIIRAKHFVIATGSTAVIPPIEGLASVSYFTNESIFDNRTRPDHLIIIGGGPIGAELAQAHRRLGSRVSIIDASTILSKEDPEAVEVVRRALLKDGVEIRENAAAKSVRKKDGLIEVDLGGETITGTHILVAVGRKANIDGLNLEKAGVEATSRGVKVNARLQSANRRIYAAGDAAGGLQFTHVAGDHASTIIRNILFKMQAERRDRLAPRVTFTDPEIAAVGVSLRDALVSDKSARAVRSEISENDRARTERRMEGFVKIVAGRGGRILGATIVGKSAGDMIQPFALAVANNMKISAFTNYIAPYPTRGEAGKRAAGAWFTKKLFSGRTRALVRLLAIFD